MSNLSRRGFLGTLIGTIAATGLPFYAEFGPMVAKVNPTLADFRMCWYTIDDERFWMPGPIGFQVNDGRHDDKGVWYDPCIVWSCPSLDIRNSMTMRGFEVYEPFEGKLMTRRPFESTVPVSNGDQLRGTYTLSLSPNRDPNDYKSWVAEAKRRGLFPLKKGDRIS